MYHSRYNWHLHDFHEVCEYDGPHNMANREIKQVYNEFIIKNSKLLNLENEVNDTEINLAPNEAFNPRVQHKFEWKTQ